MIHNDPGELVLEASVFDMYCFVFLCARTPDGVEMYGDKMVTSLFHRTKFVARGLELSLDVPFCVVRAPNTRLMDGEVVSERPELGL